MTLNEKDHFGRCAVVVDGRRHHGFLVGVHGERCVVRLDEKQDLTEHATREVIPDPYALEKLRAAGIDTSVFFQFVRMEKHENLAARLAKEAKGVMTGIRPPGALPHPGEFAEQVFKDALRAAGGTPLEDEKPMEEIDREVQKTLKGNGNWCLQFFSYEHLPPELKAVSRPFSILAQFLETSLMPNEEKDHAMRKLLEAKDCAVRAVIAHLTKEKRSK